ncbi:MAG: signal recognition particle-docking protein FtsY [Candidatus Marinimicrobia bacterium]|nr:signal recognition particle-docking protein FtsY [Candidatus Neomarinimicrobiota bacterium]|tara:strand:- start:29724 stop:30599 length:876 start_codon:yes stop_codon:yes gene_type:complete
MSLFNKTFSSLFKTRSIIRETFRKVLGKSNLHDSDYEIIEESLLSADISWGITNNIIDKIKSKSFKNTDWEGILQELLSEILIKKDIGLNKIILMVGVNGVGKTTSCAKLANYLIGLNKKVTLVAADTYRAAATNQLLLWSKQLGIDCVSNDRTADPASVAYDGVQSGLAKNCDHIIIDTAGRLQNSKNLMLELKKVYKVISKLSDNISIIMNLDANIGQNSIAQIEEFNDIVPIDTVILNKMDGTSKGGIALSIIDKFNIPISFIGIGEKIDDIVPFNINDYIKSLIARE